MIFVIARRYAEKPRDKILAPKRKNQKNKTAKHLNMTTLNQSINLYIESNFEVLIVETTCSKFLW